MVDADVVTAKVNTIKRCLNRIADITGMDSAKLEDITVQEVFVLNLQRAVQACIDLAAHVIASENLGVPEDLRGNFSLLEESGIISNSLSTKMKRMVGFRNIAVHEYQNLDVDVLKSILEKNLGDFEKFYTSIINHFNS